MQDHSSKKDSVEWQQVIDQELRSRVARVKQIAYKIGFVIRAKVDDTFARIHRGAASELNSLVVRS
jgi:hypothetical protein